MINFEDGELIKGAYVVINGVEYPVIMPKYSGKTPLTAFILNKMQEELKRETIEELSPIVLYENDEGSADSITLTDSIENYSELEIQSYAIYAEQKVFNNTGKIPANSADRIHINNMFLSTTGIQWYNKRISISGNTLSSASDRFNNNNSISNGTYTYITKIIGYK